VPALVVERCDVDAHGPDPERVRLPPVLERLVLDGEDELAVLNSVEPCRREELRQVAFAGACEAGLAAAPGIELARCLPEQAEGTPASGRMVPDASGDDAVLPRDATHLGQSGDGILHEEDDELSQCRIEPACRKRQLLGGPLPDIDSGVPLSDGGDERLGRIDRRDRGRAEPLRQLGGERARPASDVEDAFGRLHVGEVGEERRELDRVAAHEPVVRVRADGEAHTLNLLRRGWETTAVSDPLADSELDALVVDESFSGVVRIDRDGAVAVERAYGLANRGEQIANEVSTRFAVASGTKGLTALTVMTLVEDGLLALDTTARSLLGSDLPLVPDAVTVEQLLAHRSGIGDYLDEGGDARATDYVLSLPVHELATTEDYIGVLDGHPQRFVPDERFAYSNSGYVLLALLAERAAGVPFHDLVVESVCARAGMQDTAFLRSDELPGHTALGYLGPDGLRTNVLHLPVRGSGDGGVYTTASDVRALWTALVSGKIVAAPTVAEVLRPRSRTTSVKRGLTRRYGLGFWLDESTDTAILEGYDPGISFSSLHDRERDLTCTVISNWTDGAWPLARGLAERLQV
jgi:CubicO group peptidase (beta-lactamase class C family)